MVAMDMSVKVGDYGIAEGLYKVDCLLHTAVPTTSVLHVIKKPGSSQPCPNFGTFLQPLDLPSKWLMNETQNVVLSIHVYQSC
jgi:hypothetical protein